MTITRFAVINDKRKLLLGIDLAEVFEPGYVYEATKILDEVIFRKVGKYALPKKGYPSECSDVNTQVYHGKHLYTQEELEKIQKEEGYRVTEVTKVEEIDVEVRKLSEKEVELRKELEDVENMEIVSAFSYLGNR